MPECSDYGLLRRASQRQLHDTSLIFVARPPMVQGSRRCLCMRGLRVPCALAAHTAFWSLSSSL